MKILRALLSALIFTLVLFPIMPLDQVSAATTLTLRPISAVSIYIPLVAGASDNLQAESDNSDSSYAYDTAANEGYSAYYWADTFALPHHTTETGVINSVTLFCRGNTLMGHGIFYAYLYAGANFAGTTPTAYDIVPTTESQTLSVIQDTGLAFTWADVDAFFSLQWWVMRRGRITIYLPIAFLYKMFGSKLISLP